MAEKNSARIKVLENKKQENNDKNLKVLEHVPSG